MEELRELNRLLDIEFTGSQGQAYIVEISKFKLRYQDFNTYLNGFSHNEIQSLLEEVTTIRKVAGDLIQELKESDDTLLNIIDSFQLIEDVTRQLDEVILKKQKDVDIQIEKNILEIIGDKYIDKVNINQIKQSIIELFGQVINFEDMTAHELALFNVKELRVDGIVNQMRNHILQNIEQFKI